MAATNIGPYTQTDGGTHIGPQYYIVVSGGGGANVGGEASWTTIVANLRSLGLSSYGLMDMISERLENLGYTEGAVADKIKAYQKDKGYGTLNEVIYAISQ